MLSGVRQNLAMSTHVRVALCCFTQMLFAGVCFERAVPCLSCSDATLYRPQDVHLYVQHDVLLRGTKHKVDMNCLCEYIDAAHAPKPTLRFAQHRVAQTPLCSTTFMYFVLDSVPLEPSRHTINMSWPHLLFPIGQPPVSCG